MTGLALSVLSEGIASTVLPTLALELGVAATDSIWIINAYQLAVIAALFPLAALGEILGYRRVYMGGLVVFTLGSLVCALSDSLLTLTLARLVQGVGAAGIMSLNLAITRLVHPVSQLGRGLGINALTVAVSSAAAPSVASGILYVAPWQWLFAVNIPLGVLAIGLAVGALPESPASGRRPDLVSMVLNALTFGLVIIGIKGLGGPDRWQAALLLGVGAVFGVALVRRQLAQVSPMLPLDLLRLPVFTLSVAASTCAFGAHSIAVVAMPFHFIQDLGLSQAETGLLMTPWPLAVAVAAFAAGHLADRYRAALLGSIGMTVFAVGLALLAMLPADPTTPDIVWRTCLCGIGFGLFQSPNNKLLIMSAPRERSGGAGGIQSTARLLGQTLGAVLVGVILAVAPARGTEIAFACACLCAIVAAVAGGLRRAGR